MRYFVFLTILEKDISNLLDIAIFTLNQREKWGAHVTVAGPYNDTRNLPRQRAFERKVSVVGVGQFKSETQNTVFLRVGTDNLRDIWFKPDFPFNPHLTIYDGNNEALADNLYHRLKDIRPVMMFHVSKLNVVSAPSGEPLLPIVPPIKFLKDYMLPVSSFDEAWKLTDENKVELAVSAIRRAKEINLFRK
jgi:hypothetical protein